MISFDDAIARGPARYARAQHLNPRPANGWWSLRAAPCIRGHAGIFAFQRSTGTGRVGEPPEQSRRYAGQYRPDDGWDAG